MPSTPSLLAQVKHAFPHLSFHEGSDFHWDYATQTIVYPSVLGDGQWSAQLLHEIAHAELQHQSYNRDIELIGKERDAWEYAHSHLAPRFNTSIDNQSIKSAMDSYRDWLHARSTCPNCEATGLETKKHLYVCPACRHEWRVNEARLCGLQRYTIK
ncbi:MAG: hypothetical protein JWM00_231 [Candidatus Saccharibacteria bacterium]|nr:hypothetical protein [Candidatus Saccharibacteria bacterium]